MKTNSALFTRLDYCQYFLSSPINYTLTNFADQAPQFSHDEINRHLAGERITPHLVESPDSSPAATCSDTSRRCGPAADTSHRDQGQVGRSIHQSTRFSR
jgi:hypothetical protein